MKRLLTGTVVALLSTAAQADLIWNNYLTTPGPGHDGVSGLSSERNTLVQKSWVVDDAIFDNPVQVDEVRWLAVRETGGAIQYNGADVLIMDESFNPVLQVNDAPFATTSLGPVFGLELYEGRVDIAAVLANRDLPAGRYFVGARLVGNFLGQNFVATTGNGVMNGMTFGFFQSESFAQDQWEQVMNDPQIGAHEYAYQVYGTIIPEPVSLTLLGLGGVLLLGRRR